MIQDIFESGARENDLLERLPQLKLPLKATFKTFHEGEGKVTPSYEAWLMGAVGLAVKDKK